MEIYVEIMHLPYDDVMNEYFIYFVDYVKKHESWNYLKQIAFQ